MKKENIAGEKSLDFSVRIVRLYQYLCKEKREPTLARQLLRSGTSIGANLAEAESAMSRKDFTAKLYIALKECSETSYWLDLLYRTDYLTQQQYNSLKEDCDELHKILSKSAYTASHVR